VAGIHKIVKHKGVGMIDLMRKPGLLLLLALFNTCGMAYANAAAARPTGDIASQLQEIQDQLRELRTEMGNLSGRLEKIEALIPSPGKPEKLTVNLDGAPMLGQHNAKIGMVEFSDYQCPFCRRFHLETFPQLQKTYIDSGKLVFAIKNFPLDFHPLAMDAAVAVSCARRQNIKVFWDVQGELFSHQDRLGKDFYNELAKRYGLDPKKFSSCMTENKQREGIMQDLKYAQSLGVEGTPTFFIGRLEGDRLVDAVRVVGAQPARVFARVLDSFIKPDAGKPAQ
jgi:protein-disulfide isomerase